MTSKPQLSFTRPSDELIRQFIEAQHEDTFSYREVGATRSRPPAGYNVDHNSIQIGQGAKVFRRAIEAVQRWEMFNLGWVQIAWPNTPIEPGATVAMIARHFGFWSINACRIVYTIQAERRYGFAYGTLPNHVEHGEERFTVEWRPADDSVWYDILAFSRPKHILAVLGYPLSRRLQRRFARDSKQAMLRAVQK